MTMYVDEQGMIEVLRDEIRITDANKARRVYLSGEDIGYSLQYGNVYSVPGRYPLLMKLSTEDYMLGLDFLFEVRDSILIRLREVLVQALEQVDISYIPVSHNAFNRLGVLLSTVQLVHRAGMQCVFSAIPNTVIPPDSNDQRYFISGFDSNESPPLYFCARLPHKVETYDEAIEALKPNSVKIAEKKGLDVLRQGDMFAIPTKYSTRDLKKMGAHITTPMFSGLYGTVHITEKTARLPDGTEFGRGFLYHRPRGRTPDHHDLPLSDAKWYLIVKNTVPVVPQG